MLVKLKVNGELRQADVPPETTLLKMLREDLGLTGAKLGCDVGDCGTCLGAPMNHQSRELAVPARCLWRA